MENIKKLFTLLTSRQKRAVILIFVFLFLSSSLQFIGISSILIAFKIIKAQEISDLGNMINLFYNRYLAKHLDCMYLGLPQSSFFILNHLLNLL